MSVPEYRHLVEIIHKGIPRDRSRLYDGTDAADAMAASKAISDGREYVTLESLVKPAAVERLVVKEELL
jgi:hypothetical protein